METQSKTGTAAQVESSTNEGQALYDVNAILKVLPHRAPFLMIDRVLELDDGQRIVATKNVTFNEPHFNGHFPGNPVMPGVLILEAMAQAAAFLAHKSKDGVLPGKTVYLVGADDLKWKKMVLPGDTLRIEMHSLKKKRPLWIMKGEVTVAGRVVASGTLSAVESQ